VALEGSPPANSFRQISIRLSLSQNNKSHTQSQISKDCQESDRKNENVSINTEENASKGSADATALLRQPLLIIARYL
jgi:hypothetical protein